MFVVASKIDVAQDPERVDSIRKLAEERGLPFFEISAVTGQGIDALKRAMADKVLRSHHCRAGSLVCPSQQEVEHHCPDSAHEVPVRCGHRCDNTVFSQVILGNLDKFRRS